MSKKVKKANQKSYDTLRKELTDKSLYNDSQYDKSILTLSSGSLLLSLTFIKDIVPIKQASILWSLHLSWILFTITIILVFVSFRLSQIAINKHLKNATEYYLRNADPFPPNKYATCTEVINYLSGITFF